MRDYPELACVAVLLFGHDGATLQESLITLRAMPTRESVLEAAREAVSTMLEEQRKLLN